MVTLVTPEITQYTMTLLASFGAFGTALVSLLKDWRKEHLRKPNEASKYFEDLAATLTSIVHELKEKRVPRVEGTHLNGLLQDFAEETKPVSGAKIPPKLNASLLEAAKIAKTLDAWALDRIQLDDQHRLQLFANLERVAGTCQDACR